MKCPVKVSPRIKGLSSVLPFSLCPIYLQHRGIAPVAAVDDEGLRRVGPGGRQRLAELLQARPGRPGSGEARFVTAVAKGEGPSASRTLRVKHPGLDLV